MATPTLVQHVSTGREDAQTTLPITLTVRLPNPTLAGNALILGIESDGSETIATPTDDGGNTWIAGPSIATGGQQVKVYYALNVAAGTRVVSIGISGGITNTSCSAVLSEYYNVQTSGAIGPTGSVNSSSGTKTITLSGTPTAGDLVWMWGADIASLTPGITSITAGTSFTLLSANRSQGKLAQHSTTLASTSATVTTSGTDAWNLVALTLHSASAGTAPSSGIRVVGMHIEWFDTTTHTMQVPSQGNLLIGLWAAAPVTTSDVTAVSDANGNTWNLGVVAQAAGHGVAQIFYAANATTGSTETVDITYTATIAPGNNLLVMLDVSGADTSPHDVDANTTGNQTSNGNLTTTTITPSQLNSLVVNTTTIEFHTINGIVTDGNGHTPLFTQPVNSGDDNASSGGTAPSQLAEDDGKAILYNTDLTAITFIYSNTAGTNPPTGVTNWESVASVFKAAPAPATPMGVYDEFIWGGGEAW